MKLALSLFTALLVFPSTSNALTVIYTNRSLFESLLYSTVVDDYKNPGYTQYPTNAEMNAVLGETRYTPTGHVEGNTVFKRAVADPAFVYCAGCNGSFEMDFTHTSLSRANGVDAIGFNFENYDPPYSAYVTFGDGNSVDYPLPSSASLATFFGIISTDQIAKIHIGNPNGAATIDGYYVQTNLTIGRVSVPEPSSLCLCIGSIVLLGIRRRG